MPRRHAALALVVAVCWAVNFVVIVIDIGLESFPLLFVALRFGLTALPAILFVQRPDVRWPAVIAVGLFIGFGQFRLLFVAMNTELPAGLAPVIATLQPVFTIPLAAVALRERPSPRQVAGVSLAVAGIGAMAVGRAPTASPAPRFRRSAALFQQGNALHKMRHREDTDGVERKRASLPTTALIRGNWPLTCRFSASRRSIRRHRPATRRDSKRVQSAPSKKQVPRVAADRKERLQQRTSSARTRAAEGHESTSPQAAAGTASQQRMGSLSWSAPAAPF